MKKIFIVVLVLVLIAAGALVFMRYQARGQISATSPDLETESVMRGDLQITIGATGVLRANQTALLSWQTSGTVREVVFKIGDQVSTGQELGSLEQTSLPQNVILAQAELIDAQKALDDLLYSQTQQAQAQKAVEEAQQALEDAHNPELTQAHALEVIAAAQKTVDDVQLAVDILKTPVSQTARDQAYANMLLAENVLNNTLDQIEKIEKRLRKDESKYNFWESRDLYESILENLELKLTKDQRSYEDAVEKYNTLLEPPDPNDVALAEAALALAQAQLAQAERDWERLKDGPSLAEIAVLEAKLTDAQREWERLQDGPDPDDIAAAEARITAALAAINQAHLTAPFEGMVTHASNQPGDKVMPGELAFRLDNLSPLFADVQVSEVDINRIQVGQPVILTFDSILAKEYHGEVVEAPIVGEVSEGVTNFYVQVEITDADAQIKPGMTTEVAFKISEFEDVLLVPNRAVRNLEGKRVVYILQEGSFSPVEVTLGPSNETYSQVLESALQPGDQIILNPYNDSQIREAGFRHPPFMSR